MELAEAVAILPEQPVRINGGLVQNDFLCQFLADILNRPLNRPKNPSRSTAAGIVFLAGLAAGVWSGTEELERLRASECVFMPSMDEEKRQAMIRGWKCATIRYKSILPSDVARCLALRLRSLVAFVL
jgi:glycerol kinase